MNGERHRTRSRYWGPVQFIVSLALCSALSCATLQGKAEQFIWEYETLSGRVYHGTLEGEWGTETDDHYREIAQKFDGTFRAWWPSGEPYEEGQCRKGKKEGEWLRWWTNGVERSKEFFSNGYHHPFYPHISHYENGNKSREHRLVTAWYQDTYWYPDGNIYAEGTCRDGSMWDGTFWAMTMGGGLRISVYSNGVLIDQYADTNQFLPRF